MNEPTKEIWSRAVGRLLPACGRFRARTAGRLGHRSFLAAEVRYDDGRGFDPAVDRQGSGLPSMNDRLDAAGGRLTVESAPGRGTTVSGSIPVAQPAPVA